MFTLMPSELSCLHPLMPSRVVGSFTTTCLCQLAYSRPSRSIPSRSVESTSTLTGPFTSSQISLMSGLLFCLFSFAISEGFVVTPSRIPRAAASRISLMLAVSIKNFMACPFFVLEWCGYCGFYSKLYSQATQLNQWEIGRRQLLVRLLRHSRIHEMRSIGIEATVIRATKAISTCGASTALPLKGGHIGNVLQYPPRCSAKAVFVCHATPSTKIKTDTRS